MKALRALAAATALLGLSGCVQFHEDWLAAKKAVPPPHDSIEGAWIGSWTSGHNGHNGKLRCIVTKTAQDEFEFYYWATWARVISGGFKITCDTEKNDGKTAFDGDMDLGKLGGEFTHKGSATPNTINADWRSQRGDFGTFELQRPDED